MIVSRHRLLYLTDPLLAQSWNVNKPNSAQQLKTFLSMLVKTNTMFFVIFTCKSSIKYSWLDLFKLNVFYQSNLYLLCAVAWAALFFDARDCAKYWWVFGNSKIWCLVKDTFFLWKPKMVLQWLFQLIF